MGALISYASIFINIIVGILYTPWMIKQIGQSNYGLYTLAITVISFFTFDFGLGEAVSKFISKYRFENQYNKVDDFLGITFKLYFGIDIVIFIILFTAYCFLGKIYAELSLEEIEKFKFVFIIAAIYATTIFPFQPLNGILIAFEKFVFIKTLDIISRVLIVISMVFALLLGYKLNALIIVNAVSGILITTIKVLYIYKNKLIRINFRSNERKLLKEIIVFSGWAALAAFSQRLIFNITPTLLAALSGSEHVAKFAVASTIEGFVWTFTAALNGLFLPKVTRMLFENNPNIKIERLMTKVGRIQLFILGLIFSGFILVGKEFIGLWLNNDYLDVYNIVIFLIIPSLINLTQQIAVTSLTAAGKNKFIAYGYLISGITSITLSIVLSKSLGAIGAGIAICIGYSIGTVFYMNFVFMKQIQLNIVRFFNNCHVKVMWPIIITIIFGQVLKFIISSGSWILLIIKIIILSIFYFALLWRFVFNNFEKELVFQIIDKVRKCKLIF
jgi:O-antigen/teichoic acid export membrane protein